MCGENSWNKFQIQHKGIFKNSLGDSKAYIELKINKNSRPYDDTSKNEVLNSRKKSKNVHGSGSLIQLDVSPADKMDYLKPTSNYKIE